MNKEIIRLFQRPFIRGIMQTGGGIAIAHSISLLAQPFLTRIYEPHVYGLMASYVAVIAVIIPFATMSYSGAVVIAKSDRDIAALMAIARLVGICASLVCAAILAISLLSGVGMSYFNIPLEVLILIPVTIFFSANNAVLTQYAIRSGYFKEKAKAHILKTATVSFGQLIFGLIKASPLSLLFFKALEGFINNLYLRLNKEFNAEIKSLPKIGFRDLLPTAKFYSDFPKYRTPQNLINAFSLQLPVLGLTYFYESSTVGQFSLAYIMLGAPFMLMSTSFGEVFYKKISEEVNLSTGRELDMVKRSSAILLLIGILCFAPITIWGPEIFAFIFGLQWSEAGKFASAMTMWFVSSLACRPAVSVIPSVRLQSLLLKFEIIAAVLKGTVLYITLTNLSAVASIYYISALQALLYFVLFISVLFKLKGRKLSC